jgi:protein-arginine kinase
MDVKILGAILTLLSTIAVGTIAIDSRYALAAELEKAKDQIDYLERNHSTIVDKKIDELRVMQLDDRLFELRMLDNPSNYEKALIEHYNSKLSYIRDKYK